MEESEISRGAQTEAEAASRISEMAELCCSRSGVVREARRRAGMSLEEYVGEQAEKVLRSGKIRPLRDPGKSLPGDSCSGGQRGPLRDPGKSLPGDSRSGGQRGLLRDPGDFFESAARLAGERLGEEAADEIFRAAACGAICTADHHGGLFCSQTFQGDILFASLLRRLGYRGRYVPVLSASQVGLVNVTYARGICVYSSREEKQYLPIFPNKIRNQMPSHAASVTRDMIGQFRKKCIPMVEDAKIQEVLEEICRDVYEAEDVLGAGRFAGQVTLIGARLSRGLFMGEGGPVFAYLEMEEVILPLLIRELGEEDSLLFRLLKDPCARKKLCALRTADGVPLAGHLFCGADEKGRKIALMLGEDGTLSGTAMDGSKVSFSADPRSLVGLLERRSLLPGLYLAAVLLAFERGLVWMGGVFQAVYLPQWQQCTADLLKEIGMEREADLVRAMDCTGCLCGPMFALYGGDGFAATAGPAEMWAAKPRFSEIESLIGRTSLWDAHMIGLTEMYYDLSSPVERSKDWYRTVTSGLRRMYPQNLLNRP